VWIALGGVLALGAVAYGLLATRAPAPAPVAISAPQPAASSPGSELTAKPAQAASFSLAIDSTPSGAQVVEQGRVLGVTPLSITIEAASVARGPRELSLHLDGYLPFRVVQAWSPRDVQVLATLAALPAPPAEPAAARASTHRRAPRASSSARSESSPPPSAAPEASDIRLER
jgi:serine/threonine-protein kinase